MYVFFDFGHVPHLHFITVSGQAITAGRMSIRPCVLSLVQQSCWLDVQDYMMITLFIFGFHL